jgi:hypothetical protein
VPVVVAWEEDATEAAEDKTGETPHQETHVPRRSRARLVQMNDSVFECFEEQGNRRQYVKTVEALKGYVKKKP